MDQPTQQRSDVSGNEFGDHATIYQGHVNYYLQDDRNRICLEDLYLSDPRVDKRRIETTKGGLFRGASDWILSHDDFRRWHHCNDARLLWIKGNPGKGKTMLLITIVDELEGQLAQSEKQSSNNVTALSYFFCQGTNKDLNNATAILRGLVYLLAAQRPPLVSYLRASYDHAGSKLFDGEDSFFALSKVLESMLHDGRLTRVYLVVDAHDECIANQEQLLKLIVSIAAASPHVKWIVSSRNRPEIEQYLKIDGTGMKLSLEITQNAEQISRAIDAYIDFKISELPSLKEHPDQKNRVRNIIRQRVNGTFLWVALAAKELEKARSWRVMRVIERVPAGLYELCDLMTAQIQQLEEDWEFCQLVLAAATLTYRPLHLAELGILSGLAEDISANANYVKEVVALSGSFLTVQENFVYVIHQSANDYVSDKQRPQFSPLVT